jgi:hypothetical protein
MHCSTDPPLPLTADVNKKDVQSARSAVISVISSLNYKKSAWRLTIVCSRSHAPKIKKHCAKEFLVLRLRFFPQHYHTLREIIHRIFKVTNYINEML